jgi:predicted oxidoreductase
MQSDEIAEAVEKLKSEGKIVDFGLSNFTNSQTELIRQKEEVSYNQVQFSATILNLWLTEVLIICN